MSFQFWPLQYLHLKWETKGIKFWRNLKSVLKAVLNVPAPIFWEWNYSDMMPLSSIQSNILKNNIIIDTVEYRSEDTIR